MDASYLVGGLAQGFAQGKQQGQQRKMMEEYRKAQSDLIKIEAKKAEAQLNLQQIQEPIYRAIAQAAGGAGLGPAPMPAMPNQPPSLPVGNMGREVSPPMNAPLSPGSMGGGIQIPGSPENNISARQNNPFNIKGGAGYPGSIGAGTRDFSIFSTPEAGAKAGIDLISRYQSGTGPVPPGATIADMGQKYEGSTPANIQNWVKNVSTYLKVPPNTPISQIPTNNLAQAIARAESSTDITPMLSEGAPKQGLPQQIAQGQFPTPQMPQRGGVTGQKLLEGFLKKNFGVDPDEAHVVPYGDHKLVVDKRSGNPMGIIAGQGKMELIDVKLSDGSVVKRPMLVPPSPLPGGIPVINLSGQAGGNAMGFGGVQTAPPEMTWGTRTSPTGAKEQFPQPKAQEGMPPIQTESPGLKFDAGKVNLLFNAHNRMNEINGMLFPKGKINRELILKAAAPMGGIGEGTTLYSKMFQAVDAALRIETGAQAPEPEVKQKVKQYMPSIKDTDAVIKEKFKDFNEYITGAVNLGDPTGQIRQMRGIPGNNKGAGLPAGAKSTGRTSGGKPVYQLLDGQLWVQ